MIKRIDANFTVYRTTVSSISRWYKKNKGFWIEPPSNRHLKSTTNYIQDERFYFAGSSYNFLFEEDSVEERVYDASNFSTLNISAN